MKYTAIILKSHYGVEIEGGIQRVLDALYAGGVFLSETVFLPYAEQDAFRATLTRLRYDSAGIFLVCERALLPFARKVAEETVGALSGDDVFQNDQFLFAILPAGEEGKATALIPIVDVKRGKRYSQMVVRAVGVPPNLLKEVLDEARRISEDKLFFRVREQNLEIRIEAVYHSDTPKMLADEVLRTITLGLADYVYAVDDYSPAERLVDALKLRRMKVATAESFTGGGVGSAIVGISGASAVFFEGLNTYDNGSKMARLGVSEDTLRVHGAVSDEVAYQMAAGLIKGGNCDLAIATTGIAGPLSDDSKKPVGLCYIAVGTQERVRVYRHHLVGNREQITKSAINLALFYAYRAIK